QHPRGKERQLGARGWRLGPAGEHADVGFVGDPRIGQPDQAFEQDLDRHRQPGRVLQARLGKLAQRVEIEVGATQSLPLGHIAKIPMFRIGPRIAAESALTAFNPQTGFRANRFNHHSKRVIGGWDSMIRSTLAPRAYMSYSPGRAATYARTRPLPTGAKAVTGRRPSSRRRCAQPRRPARSARGWGAWQAAR